MTKPVQPLVTFALRSSVRASFAPSLINSAVLPEVRPLWHPLGFIHMRLADDGETALRLHIWSRVHAAPMQPLWSVHNHVFSLESLVIHGSIRDTRFEVAPAEAGDKQLYEVVYRENGSLRRRTGKRVHCVRNQESIHRVGDQYAIAAQMFHSSSLAEGDLAMTIVKTTGTGDGRPMVVGDLHGEDEYVFVQREVDADVLRNVIRGLSKGAIGGEEVADGV